MGQLACIESWNVLLKNCHRVAIITLVSNAVWAKLQEIIRDFFFLTRKIQEMTRKKKKKTGETQWNKLNLRGKRIPCPASLFVCLFINKQPIIHMAQRLHNKDSQAGEPTVAWPLRCRGWGGGHKLVRTRPQRERQLQPSHSAPWMLFLSTSNHVLKVPMELNDAERGQKWLICAHSLLIFSPATTQRSLSERAKRFKVRNQLASTQGKYLRLKSRFHYAFKSPQMDRRSRCKNGPKHANKHDQWSAAYLLTNCGGGMP